MYWDDGDTAEDTRHPNKLPLLLLSSLFWVWFWGPHFGVRLVCILARLFDRPVDGDPDDL